MAEWKGRTTQTEASLPFIVNASTTGQNGEKKKKRWMTVQMGFNASLKYCVTNNTPISIPLKRSETFACTILCSDFAQWHSLLDTGQFCARKHSRLILPQNTDAAISATGRCPYLYILWHEYKLLSSDDTQKMSRPVLYLIVSMAKRCRERTNDPEVFLRDSLNSHFVPRMKLQFHVQ